MAIPGGAIAILGGPDPSQFEDQLLGRVVERELLARLPGWRTNLLPVVDSCRSCQAGILRDVTAIVICAGDPLRAGEVVRDGRPVLLSGVRVEANVPPWFAALANRAALVAVRDAVSGDRLRSAGVCRDVTVVPHPGLLSHRLVDQDTLPVRVQQLRRLGVLPEEGAYLVVTGLPSVAGLDDPVVAIPGDLALEDKLAMLATSSAVITTNEHVAAASAGLGARWVLVDPAGSNRRVAVEFGAANQIVESALEAVAAVQTDRATSPRPEVALTAHFDRVAVSIEGALSAAGDADRSSSAVALAAENDAIRTAHLRQRQRILLERERLVESLAEALRERDAAQADLVRIRAMNRDLSVRVADAERELRSWHNTKLVRWTRPLRVLYGRLRAR